MLLDIVFWLLVVLALFRGLQKGFVVGLCSFAAFIIGLAAAVKFSALAAGYLGKTVEIAERYLPFVAFVLVFILVVLLVRLMAAAIEKVVQLSMLGWLNKLGGVALYLFIYLFILSVVLFYAVQLQFIKPEATQVSVTYPYIQPLAPKIINAFGEIFPLFKNMFAELEHFFSRLTFHTVS